MGKEKIKDEEKFTKEQIISSKLFSKNKDVLSVKLKDNKEYSKKEVQEVLENFMKGKVI